MKYEIEGGSLPVVILHMENGEQIITQGGAMSWMSSNMKMSTTTGGGIKNTLFGGEGFFNTVITGPGKVIVQSMPLGKLRNVLGIDALEAKINNQGH